MAGKSTNHVFTIRTGTPTISTASSKFGGSSLLIEGSESIQSSSADGFNLPTVPWTIEFWINIQSTLPAGWPGGSLLGKSTFAGRPDWDIQARGGRLDYDWFADPVGNGSTLSTSQTWTIGTWVHWAFVANTVAKSGHYMFRDGVDVTDGANSTNLAELGDISDIFWIGDGPGAFGTALDFYMDELRISEVARWTSGFTPPTAPYVADKDTSLLMHFDGTNGSTDFLDTHTDLPAKFPKVLMFT